MKRQNWLAITFALLIALTIGATWYIRRLFPESEIDTMVFYLANGAAAASSQTITLAVKTAGPLILLIFIALFLLVYRPRKKHPLAKLHVKKLELTLRFPHLRRRSRREKHVKISNRSLTAHLPIDKVGKLNIALIYGVIFLITVTIAVNTLGATAYVKRRYLEKTQIYAEHYVYPKDVEITFPERKRNLVMIFSESMESTMTSRTNGGGWDYSVIPELEQLAQHNTNFSATNKIGGTQRTANAENTTTGLVAQTSGTPLMIGDDINLNNAFNNYTRYVPGLVSLADILRDNGYNQQMLMGSDANFGNRKTYFEQHGGVDIIDYEAAKAEGRIPQDYDVWWGFEDKKVFSYAREEVAKLAAKDQPFVQTVLTADTHFVDGWLDPSCDTPFSNKYENVYACSSKMISGYISWLQQQDFYKDTTIIVVGDHLGMQTDFYTENIPENYTRTIFDLYINAPLSPTKEKERTFMSFDTFPTTLASMGVTIEGDKLGFGTNLFSSQPTLAETIGLDNVNNEVKKHSSYYQACILGGDCN